MIIIPKPCLRTEKPIDHKSDGDTNCNWCAQYSYQRISISTGELGNKSTSGHHLNPSEYQESWGLEETCCHWYSSEKPSADAGVKNSQKRKMIIS